MPDKKDDFKIDPKPLHGKNPIANAVINGIVDAANKLDLNHDGRADVAQLAPFVLKVMPTVLELSKLIDWAKVAEFVLATFVKQPAKQQFLTLCDQVKQEATKVA